MSTNSISDWIVSLGVEVDSKAIQRVESLEKRMSKIMTNSHKRQAGSLKGLNRQLAVQVELLRRRNALLGVKQKPLPINASPATPRQPASGKATRMTPLEKRGIDQLGFRGGGVNKGINIDGKMDVDIARAKGLNTTEGNTAAKELGRIKKEMADVIAMSKKTGVNIDALNKKFGRLAGEAKGVTQALNKQSNATHNANFATKSLVKSATHLLTTYASVFAIIQGGRAFFNLGKDMESTKAVMMAATGDAKSAGEAFEFVKEHSIRLGQSVKVSAKSFAKFGAAARGSGIEVEKMKEMFVGISEVNLAFQLDTQSAGLAFLAFEQMLSKGKVSMEELRRQLGERWFGAFTQAAEALDIDTPTLDKLVSSGQLMSAEFAPKLIAQMNKFVKESGAFDAALKKVATAQGGMIGRFETAVDISFTRAAPGLHSFFTNIGFAIEELSPLINVFGKVFSELGRTIGFVSLVLSPVIGLLASSFDTLFDAIERASDTDRAWKDLTAIEVVLRGLVLVGMGVKLAILSVSWAISKLSKMLRVGEKDTGKFAKQFGALLVAFVVARKLLKLLGTSFKGMLAWVASSIVSVFRYITSLGAMNMANITSTGILGALSNGFVVLAAKSKLALLSLKNFAKGAMRIFAPIAIVSAAIDKTLAETEEEDTRANVSLGAMGIGAAVGAGLAPLTAGLSIPVGIGLGAVAGALLDSVSGDAIAKQFTPNIPTKNTTIGNRSTTLNLNNVYNGDTASKMGQDAAAGTVDSVLNMDSVHIGDELN
jgi:tape measure domain-containing protein